ncbi:MAG TPA: hypothetical protein VMH83_09585 [Candidatus Acidoferrum sp.]|nr:hypothetical protein [Candidatus Acidoferrum sp.]
MKRTTLLGLALAGALLAPVLTVAQQQPPAVTNDPVATQINCSRVGLQNAAKAYVAAQTKGSTAGLPLANGLGYYENNAPVDIKQGIIMKPLKVDNEFTIADTSTCQTFTQVIVTDKAAPYVLGTRLRVNHDKIAEIETVWTTTGYWLFNAEAYLKYATTENWGPLAVESRTSRGDLEAAANAYLDAFLEGKKDLVPWGYPCQRTEGGAYTGKGQADDSCDVGVPSGVNIANRHYVVDEVTGNIVAICTFGAGSANGGSGAADTHFFHVEKGKLRYVHTLTHLLQASFRGNNAGQSTNAGQSSNAGK